jgi:hypothetical protein
MLQTATRNRRLVTKRSVDLAGHQKFWEVREKCSVVDADKGIVPGERKVFRCIDCGAVTKCDGDWNGEPDINKCSEECQARTKALRASLVVTDNFRRGYEGVQWEG